MRTDTHMDGLTAKSELRCWLLRFAEAEKDYEHAIELEPWEREHGRQLSQVKSQLAAAGGSAPEKTEGGDAKTVTAK